MEPEVAVFRCHSFSEAGAGENGLDCRIGGAGKTYPLAGIRGMDSGRFDQLKTGKINFAAFRNIYFDMIDMGNI